CTGDFGDRVGNRRSPEVTQVPMVGGVDSGTCHAASWSGHWDVSPGKAESGFSSCLSSAQLPPWHRPCSKICPGCEDDHLQRCMGRKTTAAIHDPSGKP